MRPLMNGTVRELLTPHQGPCISLYQPTHRRRPATTQDPIRFRNLLAEIEKSLRQKYPKREVGPLLNPLRAYEQDIAFWDHQLDGLAMFASPDALRVLQLQRPVPALTVVADSFHLKPLLRIVQSADRFQVLCLSREQVSLYEGNRDALDPVDLDDVPRTLVEALGDERTGPHLTVASYGGIGGPGMRHGHGSKADEDDIDLERYFRVVDRALLKHESAASDLPLLLAALPRHQAVFRRVSHNKNLVKTGIEFHPDGVAVDRLRAEAWKIFAPHYQSRIMAAIDRFRLALSRGAASDDLTQVAEAVVQGRVDFLLVDADRHVAGRIDAASGQVTLGHGADPGLDDVLDDCAEFVLVRGGTVCVVPTDQMPTDSGVAAIYRF